MSSIPFLHNRAIVSALRANIYTNKTSKLYSKAYQKFILYCEENGECVSSLSSIDHSLSSYIEHLFLSGESPSLASNTLFSIQYHIPQLKSRLYESKQTLRGWNKLSPKMSRPPLTKQLTTVIAVSMAKAGYHNAAIATLLAFDTYLRVGELTSLKVCDVASAYNFDLDTNVKMAIGLAKTKTGVQQSVVVEDRVVQQLLRAWVKGAYNHGVPLSAADSLFGLSTYQYRKLFRLACDSVGIGHIGFTPHSLRHGGATHDFMCDRSLESILLRGRWAVSKSARTYIQSGRFLLIGVNVPHLQTIGAKLINSNKLHKYLYKLRYIKPIDTC